MITEAAPAKLNLTLRVIGRRADGYHLLDSIVAFADYGDTVTVEAADRLSLTVDGLFSASLDGAGSDNLVIRAARLLAKHAGISPAATIRLTKRLPVASGIGGGSSDAAATLRALSALWALDMEIADLMPIGLALGADVPVCLLGRTARLGGIGDVVTPLPPLPPTPIVLVNPGIHVPTPAVFRRFNGAFSRNTPSPWPDAVPDAATLAGELAPFENDLSAPAIGLAPEIADVLTYLRTTSGCLLARMSGSGATCFGLFGDAAAAEIAAATLSRNNPAWWSIATRLSSA